MGGGGGETRKKTVKNRKYRLRRNKCIILVPQFFCLCTLYKYLEKLYTLLHIFKATSIIFHGKHGDPRTKGQINPRRVWDAGMERPDPYRPSRPHVVTVNGTVYPVSPPTPGGEGICPAPPLTSIHASSNQQTTGKIPIPHPVPWV